MELSVFIIVIGNYIRLASITHLYSAQYASKLIAKTTQTIELTLRHILPSYHMESPLR